MPTDPDDADETNRAVAAWLAKEGPSVRRRLLGHAIRMVVGMVSLGGLVLFVYLVVDAVSSGPMLFIIATVVMLVFGAPVFVLGLLAATWKTGVSRVIRHLLRPRSRTSPQSPS